MERLEKLMRFRSIILSEVSQRCREIDGEVEEYRKLELAQAEDTVLKDSYHLIQKEVAEINAETTKTVSRMRVEMKRKLYTRRDEFVEQIFAEARGRLAQFAASGEYKAFLLEKTHSLGAIGADGARLLVSERDLVFKAELTAAYGRVCSVEASPAVKLGGVIAEDAAGMSVADESLDAILEAQRKWLYSQPDFVVAI